MSSLLTRPRFPSSVGKSAADRGIAGVAAVVLLLAGTRWGSYIGGGGLFLTDILIAGALVHYIVTVSLKPKSLPSREFEAGSKPVLLIALLVFVTLRFLFGAQFGLLAIRDAVPYFYAIVGVLAWVAVSRSSQSQRTRTVKLLSWALAFHAAWFFVVTVLWPGLPDSMPSVSLQQSLHLFTPRNDIDTALIGIYAGYLMLRIIRGTAKYRALHVLGFLMCWVAVFFTGSRAGLIGALIATAFAYLCAIRNEHLAANSRIVALATLPLLLGVVLLVAPQTTVGTKLMSSVGMESQYSKVAADADGTQRARANAWDRMIDWTFEDATRGTVGSGFGQSILSESGADVLLVGSAEVGETVPRSPHNYWIGSLARLGLVGTGLLILMTLGHVWRAIRRPRPADDDEFRFLVAVIPIALIVPATLGVVLESPFGAVPFFWCIGAFLALSRRPKITDEKAP